MLYVYFIRVLSPLIVFSASAFNYFFFISPLYFYYLLYATLLLTTSPPLCDLLSSLPLNELVPML